MKKGISILLLLLLTTLCFARHRDLHPKNDLAKVVGQASWYGRREQGKKMANGKPFDKRKFTCASRWLPFGTWIRVYNSETMSFVDVQVTDRGPYASVNTRVLDLSEAAARKIGCIQKGVCDIIYTAVPTNQGKEPEEYEATNFSAS